MAIFNSPDILLVLVVVWETSIFRVSSQIPDPSCVDGTPFADPASCTRYIQCFEYDGIWYSMHLECPVGGHWEDVGKSCVRGTCGDPTTAVVTTEAPTTTGPTTAGTPPPAFQCYSAGIFAHPSDPTKYFKCFLEDDRFYYYIYSCPHNSCFNASAGLCVVGTCLGGGGNSTVSIPPPMTTVSTPMPSVIIECSREGSFPIPGSCTTYYKCRLIEGSLEYYIFDCPPNLYFDSSRGACVNGTCPSSTRTTAPTTTITVSTVTCTEPGYFAFPDNCKRYYQCVKINGRFYFYTYDCPPFTIFDATSKKCTQGIC